jgi:hypothetical protein
MFDCFIKAIATQIKQRSPISSDMLNVQCDRPNSTNQRSQFISHQTAIADFVRLAKCAMRSLLHPTTNDRLFTPQTSDRHITSQTAIAFSGLGFRNNDKFARPVFIILRYESGCIDFVIYAIIILIPVGLRNQN